MNFRVSEESFCLFRDLFRVTFFSNNVGSALTNVKTVIMLRSLVSSVWFEKLSQNVFYESVSIIKFASDSPKFLTARPKPAERPVGSEGAFVSFAIDRTPHKLSWNSKDQKGIFFQVFRQERGFLLAKSMIF
ncbi:hypothetical protein LEP1GSC137_0932 [Leptospira borgpetersenii str. Noumea 25]|nr:hypothetical protein LBBP_02015 [Leptospira borgpetersenii serovar Ballum]EKR01736.1 hypothetical protein LEP1GSC121_3883 [Leptospira borgpetersenii serovar Castellonis str. 200801910]EMO11891.1 hypothetical protein LEP1GSC137_0932 [Leptospira borgpetersenii str. Noumea 25]KGE22395.1 hypothetical protein IQ66_16485 [Leptospira borgpetersenii serovar Ballum]OOV44848.1 hypothetical protein B1H38_07260 [Leptospira borgpetersenii serovar Ballum]